jgi:signal transduction histidine kinase
MQQRMDAVDQHDVSHLPENQPVTVQIQQEIRDFTAHVSALATSQDPVWAMQHRGAAIDAAIGLRQDILTLNRAVKLHGDLEQSQLTGRFRTTVLVLSIVFILVLNVSVISLVRIAAMVVKPVDRLVLATEALAQEKFDHRIELQQYDEFDVLAAAFNNLAQRLEANERRKLETLQQLAIALNHELNNVTTIISMQIQLIGRQTGGNPLLEKYTRQIHASLDRMTQTLESIKHLKRIVLTDYMTGVKMLDIERSVAAEESSHESQPTVARD